MRYQDFSRKIIIIISIFAVIFFTDGKAYTGSDISISLSEVKSFTLDNGIKTFYIKDELPQLLIKVSIGYGKLYETGENAGISDLLASTMSMAGSKKYPADVLHQTVESIGGKISITSQWEETYITIRVLAKYAGTAFSIISDLISNPDINPVYIEKARSLLIESLRRKKDDPDMLAFEKLREIIFGGEGYGAVPTEKTLTSVAAKDLSGITNKYFNGNNIIIGVSSSIAADAVKKHLDATLNLVRKGGTSDYDTDVKKLSASVKEKAGKIYLLPKEIPQATIAVGTIAPSIKDRAAFPLTEMDYILGGSSFTSRLMNEIRVKRGLSYSVQSVMRFRKKTGIFIAFAQTKNETAGTALSLILENIKLITEEPVSDDELKWTKESIRNSYIFEFDTHENLLNKYLFTSYNGLPDSYHRDYIKNIGSVSREDILKYSREIFKNGLIKVVVGDISLKNTLGKFGDVTIVAP
ncbi:MAG: insulinase family protein [Spirochaetes bacterium]|nr:insulinase family protein [Spirochaetota bacterium]